MQYRDMQHVLALNYVLGWNSFQVLSSIGKPKDWLNKKKSISFDIYTESEDMDEVENINILHRRPKLGGSYLAHLLQDWDLSTPFL